MIIIEPPLKAVTVKLDAIYLIFERYAGLVRIALIDKKTGKEKISCETAQPRYKLKDLENGVYELVISGGIKQPMGKAVKTQKIELIVNCNPVYRLFNTIKDGSINKKQLLWVLKNNAHFGKLFGFYRMANLPTTSFKKTSQTNDALLKIFLEESDSNILCNALLLIGYTFPKPAIIKSYRQIFEKTAQMQECDKFRFALGLIAHKADNYYLAENLFGRINFESCDEFMRPAKNYKYLIEPRENNTQEVNIEVLRTARVVGNAVFLISCDYSYFLAYIDSLLDSGNATGTIHFHLILNERELAGLEEILCQVDKSANGLSYSLAPSNVSVEGIKTFYACARYLVLEPVFELYQKSIFVVDIDMNFSSFQMEELLSQVDESTISLLFSVRDLPWANIMAGFNYFGKYTFPSSFVYYIKSFIDNSYHHGNYAWTLDQMALNYAYRSLSLKEKSLIKPLFPKSSQLGYVNYYRRKANEIKKIINEENA